MHFHQLFFNHFFLDLWHSHISTKHFYFDWNGDSIFSGPILCWALGCSEGAMYCGGIDHISKSLKKFDNILDKFAFFIFHVWVSKCGPSPIITAVELVWLCRTVFFGVYKCWGPGAEAVRGGVTWARELDFETAHPFLVKSFVNGRHWIAPSDA